MRIIDIVNQLFTQLPLYTDYFTDDIPVTQITSSALVASVQTSAPHGLITGDYAYISGTLVPNDLINLTSADGIASAETASNHDQTESQPGGFQFNVEIIGANESEYNGTHALLTVPNRKNLTYSITGTPSSPATGSPKLLENLEYGYNGWQEITKIDDNNFTYAIPKILGSPAYGTILCKAPPRISGSVSIERALAAYTKQNIDKLWAFVVLGNRTANKDRNTITDAIYTPGQGVDYKQVIIQPFSVFVIIPTTQEIAARAARDLCDELLPYFCKSLLRVKLPSNFTQPPYSGIVFAGDDFDIYKNAYYVHEFVFETTEYITYDDTFKTSRGVAFRDIDIDYISSFSDNIFMTDKINLDDEPL